MKNLRIKLIVFLFILFAINLNTASGWYDETHLAVAKAAGYSKWYNATGADITKTKAGSIEFYNHYFDNNSDIEVTPEMVMSQISKYNNPADKEGHLYGTEPLLLHCGNTKRPQKPENIRNITLPSALIM